MKHEGIIFDLDGTLADTLEDLADSMNRAAWMDCRSQLMTRQYYRQGVTPGCRNAPRKATEDICPLLRTGIGRLRKQLPVKTQLYNGIARP